MKFEWERLWNPKIHTFRAKVIGGWIVFVYDQNESIVFIPDPEHKWKIDQ